MADFYLTSFSFGAVGFSAESMPSVEPQRAAPEVQGGERKEGAKYSP